MTETPRWGVFETTVSSAREYDNPLWDLTVQSTVIAPSGKQHVVDAFWDGAYTWRMRFSPDEVGEWQWVFRCSDTANTGLHRQEGGFGCVPYAGDNPLYQRGPIRLSEDRRHFMHVDGSPFFWLSDTAWNGALRSKEKDWASYLQTRRQQGFSAIQFVSTQWRGCSQDSGGETAFAGTKRIRIRPRFFQRLDHKVAAINAHGLIAAPVLLWAFAKSDPGRALSEADAIRLARYLVARWGAYQVIWLLGGDGDYGGRRSKRWKRIGHAVFDGRRERLVTMHPRGQTWVGDEFRGEAWFDFVGYQSGHGSSQRHLRWLVSGPPASKWREEPPLAVVNLEPNYEAHPSHDGKRITSIEVRRAAYWSLLLAPTAGLTFGHNSIWVWADKPEAPEGHEYLGLVEPWRQGLDSPGAQSMVVLRRFFDSLPWWRLRPAPEILIKQQGKSKPHQFAAAAKTDDGALAVVYLPQGGSVTMNLKPLKCPASARWFNPRTEEWVDAITPGVDKMHTFTALDNGDWILCIRETV